VACYAAGPQQVLIPWVDLKGKIDPTSVAGGFARKAAKDAKAAAKAAAARP
jgi:hypothetical protein